MNYKHVLIVGVILSFIIWLIALVVMKKTKNSLTKGKRVINIIAKIVFWINTLILSPFLIGFGIDLVIIYFLASLIFSKKK